jgi:hypothetical protein
MNNKIFAIVTFVLGLCIFAATIGYGELPMSRMVASISGLQPTTDTNINDGFVPSRVLFHSPFTEQEHIIALREVKIAGSLCCKRPPVSGAARLVEDVGGQFSSNDAWNYNGLSKGHLSKVPNPEYVKGSKL